MIRGDEILQETALVTHRGSSSSNTFRTEAQDDNEWQLTRSG
jgi:hypothetical protein